VKKVRQRIHDRHIGMLGQLHDLDVVECPNHDAVDHSGKHPRGVSDLLPPPDLAVPLREEQRMTSQLRHAHLEGDTGSGGALAEDHGQALPRQHGGVVPPL
jgi:hypothetical protein